MAKSTQSFNKKEREKKQQQKRQDKEQKKEDRKNLSSKGKSIDDMMAYVDDYGNITSVPPDPDKKKKPIEQDSIQINIPKQSAEDKPSAVRNGTVTFYNDSKGYGFIKDLQSQESIFVHASELLQPIKERDKVTFEVEHKPKGPNAIKVKPI
jgi:cold shock CspA family protein